MRNLDRLRSPHIKHSIQVHFYFLAALSSNMKFFFLEPVQERYRDYKFHSLLRQIPTIQDGNLPQLNLVMYFLILPVPE